MCCHVSIVRRAFRGRGQERCIRRKGCLGGAWLGA